MDKKTTPSFSSSSVKPRTSDDTISGERPQPSEKTLDFFVAWPVITGLYLSFRKACRG